MRRPFDDGIVRRHQKRLAKLVVPAAEAHRVALGAVQVEPVAEQVVADRLELGRLGAQDALHDGLDRDPGAPVLPRHAAAGKLLEPAVHLRGALALPGPVPGLRNQPRRANHRTRGVGLVGHIAAELAVRVGHIDDVVVVAGRQQGDIALVAQARVVGEQEGPDVDDVRAKTLGGALQRIDQRLVLRKRPLQDEDFVPLLGREILADRVGQHQVARIDVRDVGAAIGGPQPVVRRGGVQQQDGLVGDGVGELQERVGGEVRDDEVNAPADPPAHRLGKLLDARPGLALQQEVRADYLADLLAVGDAELGAGDGAAKGPQLDAGIGIVLVVARVVGELGIADGEILHGLGRLRLRRCGRRRRSLAGSGLVLRLSAARHAQEQRRGKPTGAACRPLSHRRGPSGARARPGRTW